MSSRPAIFLDRDGTLNHAVGFVNHPSLFLLYPWAVEAVHLINRSGFLAVLTTNQSGIGRGFFGEPLVRDLHKRLEERLAERGARLDGIFFCPHRPDDANCGCRKPKPGMVEQASKELDIDLARSFVVGDSYSDLEMGWRVGARAALVMTGYGKGSYEMHRHQRLRSPDVVAPNLYSAVVEILTGGGS